MNRRLGSAEHPSLIATDEPAFVDGVVEGEDATREFGVEEVTVVGGARDVHATTTENDEPTREYPREGAALRGPRGVERYVRLRLTDARIARLWVRRLAPLDVLVWWDERQTWAPVLSVPEMRSAIAAMRKNDGKQRRDELPPPPTRPTVSDVPHGSVELRRPSWVEEWRQRVEAESRMTPAVRSLVSGALPHLDPATALRPKDLRPPPSSLPPMVVDVPSPQIPRPPRVPSLDQRTVANPAPRTIRPPPPSARASAHAVAPPRRGLGRLERAAWLAAAAVLSLVVLFGRRPAAPGASAPSAVAAASMVMPSPGAARMAGASPRVAPAISESTVVPSLSASNSPPRSGAHKPPVSAVPAMRRAVPPRAALATSTPDRKVSAARTPLAAAPAKPLASVGAQLGGFDRSAARRALVSAAQRVGYCAQGSVSGSVVITFSTSGFVQSASLTSLQGEKVRADCVLRAFQAVRITPFEGRPVTVAKRFGSP